MRLLVSGLAGVAVAALIFASVIVIVSINTSPQPRSPKVLLGVSTAGENELLRVEGPKGVFYSGSIDRFLQPPRNILNVTVSEFTRPLGPGSQTNLSVSVTSKLDVSELYYLSITIYNFPNEAETGREGWGSGGISLADGGLEWSWTGNIDSNSSKTFNLKINATGLGLASLQIRLKTDPALPPSQWVGLAFEVVPDNIFVGSAYPLLIPYVFSNVDETWVTPRPWGVGAEFNVSASIYGGYWENVTTSVTYKLILQEGIIAVQGPTTWTGNITTGDEVHLSTIIRFVKTGSWFMYAYVEKDGILVSLPEVMEFVVSENDIVIRKMP